MSASVSPASLVVKQYDTYPPEQAVLTDSNGPINLTAASQVSMVLKGQSSSAIVHGGCSIGASPTGGYIVYGWGASDTAIADLYEGEFQISWAGGGIQKVPNALAENFYIEIDASIDGSVG